MVEQGSPKRAFNWLLPVYAAAATSIIFVPFALASADFGYFLYVFAVAPIASLVLIILVFRKTGKRRLSALSILMVFWAVSAVLVENFSAIRDAARWILWSRGYKAAVLEQPASGGGGLKHTEWDVWGFVGMDTVAYLVFDPHDTLAGAPKDHLPGKFGGLPCEVSQIRRLESHWYAVTFYTDSYWDHCG